MNEIPEVGDRVRALQFAYPFKAEGLARDEQGLVRDPIGHVITVDDNVTVPPGTLGTVDEVSEDTGQIHVTWDNGRHLALLIDSDTWELHDGLLCVVCRHVGLGHGGDHVLPGVRE